MPSSFFDDFAATILDIHGDDTKEGIYLIETDGTVTDVSPARYNEAFRAVEVAEGAMVETTQPIVWVLESKLPAGLEDGDPMGSFVGVGDNRYRIIGSEPDGYGERRLVLQKLRDLSISPA